MKNDKKYFIFFFSKKKTLGTPGIRYSVGSLWYPPPSTPSDGEGGARCGQSGCSSADYSSGRATASESTGSTENLWFSKTFIFCIKLDVSSKWLKDTKQKID